MEKELWVETRSGLKIATPVVLELVNIQCASFTSEPIYAFPWTSSGAAYAGLPQHVISS